MIGEMVRGCFREEDLKKKHKGLARMLKDEVNLKIRRKCMKIKEQSIR
jgi:hypothetical protein